MTYIKILVFTSAFLITVRYFIVTYVKSLSLLLAALSKGTFSYTFNTGWPIFWITMSWSLFYALSFY
jgi:hypothetical protein